MIKDRSDCTPLINERIREHQAGRAIRVGCFFFGSSPIDYVAQAGQRQPSRPARSPNDFHGSAETQPLVPRVCDPPRPTASAASRPRALPRPPPPARALRDPPPSLSNQRTNERKFRFFIFRVGNLSGRAIVWLPNFISATSQQENRRSEARMCLCTRETHPQCPASLNSSKLGQKLDNERQQRHRRRSLRKINKTGWRKDGKKDQQKLKQKNGTKFFRVVDGKPRRTLTMQTTTPTPPPPPPPTAPRRFQDFSDRRNKN
ncbi:hypothetical protein GWI33_005568 [Rhynchophorus ferrugineus]|uniref:Uncharacterized protein n=1 Tax=Rhynchophorus ferrugineus TaxID=354439 RepID=A0A834MFY3_RHYFE|nr:hypothetical protein GWI33_005568 [Rhynchophorus ferrugineus]